jgi:glycosyltransferase involved in cell wall biosynthesis
MKISCVMPAYNEAKHIDAVLGAVAPLVGGKLAEVIVVDDASTDGTGERLARWPEITALTNEANRGKSYSVARGIEAATGDYVLLLDADLECIAAADVEALLAPIEAGEADAAISIRANSPWFMKRIHLDFMSGERVIPRPLAMSALDRMKGLRNFGLEVFINRLLIDAKCRVRTVAWKRVKNRLKFQKRGLFRGSIAEARMWGDILRTVSVGEMVGQNRALLRLRI